MRILMLLESDFPPDIRVENEIDSLTLAGHEVHIACYSHKKTFTLPDNLNYVIHKRYISPFYYKASVGALKFGFYFQFWRKFIGDILDSDTYDAIHIHDLPLAKIGHEISKKYGLKFILDLHENWPALLGISTHANTFLGKLLCSIPQWEAYEKKYVNLADKVIVVVDEAKSRLESIGIPPEKVVVVSNTLNMELFSFPDQHKDPDHITIVYGGGVNYHRGLQFVIRALPLLKEQIPNIRLWIIGSGNYLDTLKSLANSMDVEDFVTFWGWKQQQELLELISQGDYAVIPHIRSAHTDATIPHKIFQYMYAGIPIISSDCSPLKRILGETETGVCFKNESSESFADTFMELLKNRAFLNRMPENGKRWVEEKYNWAIESKTLIKVYNE